jgi:hypothetical protein
MAVEAAVPLVRGHAELPKEVILPPWVQEPYRLWSLLDIMQIVDPEFLDHLLRFHNLGGLVNGVQKTLNKLGRPDLRITGEKPFLTLEEAEDTAEWFAEYGLPRSGDILREWVKGHPKLPFETVMPELQRSIERELRASLFLYLPENKRRYFEGRHLFGETVTTAFPSAALDIEDAGKCFALGRFTACVFHLMRAMEVVLRVLAKTLNEPSIDPRNNPSWDSILKKCYKEQGKDRRDRAQEWAADPDFFSAVTTTLMGVKDAWRNPTMHVEINYDEERALDIINAVRCFMRHVSRKLSESP